MGRCYKILCQLAAFVAVVASSGGRVDTHFHALPPVYKAAIEAARGDPSGYPSPEWTLAAAIESMNTVGTSIGIPNREGSRL